MRRHVIARQNGIQSSKNTNKKRVSRIIKRRNNGEAKHKSVRIFWKKELDPSERSPSITTRTMSQAGRSSGGEQPTETGPTHRSNRAQGGEQFLIVRDVSLVYVREHRSNVRTIEQILFKYSRGRRLRVSAIYTLHNTFYIWYGLNGNQEKHGIPSSTLLRFSGGWRFDQFFNFQKSVMSPPFPCSFSLSLLFFPLPREFCKTSYKEARSVLWEFRIDCSEEFWKELFFFWFFSLSQIVIGTLLGVCVLWNDLKVCVSIWTVKRERERENHNLRTSISWRFFF